MAYTKHTWTTGEVITAGRLNNMEDGIAGGTLVIGGFTRVVPNITGTADKTWQEIHDALVAGKECVAISHDGDTVDRMVIYSAWRDDETGTYYIAISDADAECNSPDGYPSIDDGGK